MTDRALVLLSGGQDSTTCLYWAMNKFGRNAVSSIAFDYGQRHRIELDCARQIADSAGVQHTCLPIDTFTALGGNALTAEIGVEDGESAENTLPNTFVPGRNIIFLSFAAAYAWQHDINHMVTGVAQTDYSGYPDCREETIKSLQQTLRLGMASSVDIHTPLMHLSKKETVLLAVSLGAVGAMAFTHTCYNGQRPPCGNCAACILRAKGFSEAGIVDPLLSR